MPVITTTIYPPEHPNYNPDNTTTIFRCTKDDPYTAEKAGDLRVQHTDAYEYGDIDDEIALMTCKNCNHRWRMEIPQ